MSYVEPEPTNYPVVWPVLGWLHVLAITLIVMALLPVMFFTIAFCDAPGSCTHAGTYLVVALAAPSALWLWLLVSLLRKRHLIAPVVVALMCDIVAVAWIVFSVMQLRSVTQIG